MRALYTAVLAAALAGYAPAAVYRRLARGTPLNLRARLGWERGASGPGRSAWVHAVSVGEALAAAPLLEGLARAHPELPLVVTTVTDTAARLVRERYAALATHRYFPLDLPGPVGRTVARIDPAYLILMETEIWPNTLRAVAARGAPAMIANGRLSDRSWRRYRLARRFLRSVLADVRVFAMQSEEDARRIIALGADPERVFVTGNLKHDAAPDPPGLAELWRRLLGLGPDQPVWVAGSTRPGEEELVLEAHATVRAARGDAVLVLAPRHPARVAEVLELVRRRGWPAVRRSELPRARSSDGVIVLDTLGELAQLYAAADVVFVGGSLVPTGGQNVLEPAQRRKPVLFGPHTANFREATALLTAAGGGIVIRNAAQLGAQVLRLLGDAELRARVGEAARQAVAARVGAAGATLELVARFLYPGART